MKSLALAILLCAPGYALDIDRMLYAIAQVESGGNHKAIGKAGERSQYQLTQATWRRYTRAPFVKATTDPVLARMVARSHVQFLDRQTGNVPRGWNPNADADYRKRVMALYKEAR